MSWPGSLWAGEGWTKSWGRFEALPAPKKPSSSVAQLVCHMSKGAQCHTPGCWPPELSQHAVGKCHQCLERDCSVWVFSAAGAACRRGAVLSTAWCHQNACSNARQASWEVTPG